MKRVFILLFLTISFFTKSQIVIDNTAPFNSPVYLIDNILISGGISPTNHSFIGDPMQIGFFNGVNSNLGIDSGIVLSSGSILDLIGPNSSGSTSTSFSLPGDSTLDAIIAPDPTNDAAVLEFDFVPTSDVISFKYVFGSEEYLEFVASFNDVFGFFLSGPNPAGGNYVDYNLAIIPGTGNTPVSIFNVNNVANSTYYIDNGDGFTAPQNTDPTVIQFDGFTTPLIATAPVNCGDTYHIKLVVADAVDWSYDSGIFLEAGSFFSPPLQISDNLNIDSTLMNIACNGQITLTANGGSGATYQWFDLSSNIIGTNDNITVGAGSYIVSADILGCATVSDTLVVVENSGPFFDLGPDYSIACNTTTILDPIISGGLGPSFYQYNWSDNSTESSVEVSNGTYFLEVNDGTGCFHIDTITITEDISPIATISGGGELCDDGSTTDIFFNFTGLLPWNLTFSDGVTSYSVNNISDSTYLYSTSIAGNYTIELADDINNCIASISPATAQVIVYPLPVATINPSEIVMYSGAAVTLSTENYLYYWWYTSNDSLISQDQNLTVLDSGTYYVFVEDENGCTDISDIATVASVPLTQLFVPTVFTPNNDEHNETFVIKGNNIKYFYLRIFNRWGELLYESNSINKYWDGTYNKRFVPQGGYYYFIDVVGKDNNSFTKSGTINVMY